MQRNTNNRRELGNITDFDKLVIYKIFSNPLRWTKTKFDGRILPLRNRVTERSKYENGLEVYSGPSICRGKKLSKKKENTLPDHPSIFEKQKKLFIQGSAMETHNFHGRSWQVAKVMQWIRILFVEPPKNMCRAIAKLARAFASSKRKFRNLARLNASHFKTLGKTPMLSFLGRLITYKNHCK